MHLIKRKNIYYYKIKIPVDLQHLIKRNELRFSLRTPNKRDALTLSSKFTSNYYNLFSQLRSGIYSNEEVISLVKVRLNLNIDHNPISVLKKSLPKYHSLKSLSQKYQEDKMLTNSWTDKTLKAFEFSFMLFSKVIKDTTDIKEVNREDLQHYKSTLAKLPKLNKTQYNLSINQIVKLKQVIISTSTANKYLGYITSFFKWCEVEGYVSKSVATGLKIKEDKSKTDSRVPYSLSDLHKIFLESPIYTTELQKSLLNVPERFYIPYIALYQGMRINEISQLYVDDIYKRDGVYCIDINRKTKDKRLKNNASIRVIPIHQKLIDLGLINHVVKQRANGEIRLWSNLKLGLEGYGTNFRKWYGTYNRKYVTKDSTKTFHSFRHSFTDTLKKISLNESIDHQALKYLLGHSFRDDITMDVYSHGYHMSELKMVLDKLNYFLPKNQ